MSSDTHTSNATKCIKVGLGNIALTDSSTHLVTLLGSCVGVTLFDPNTHFAALAHVVLPYGEETVAHSERFANVAIPSMIRQLAACKVAVSKLQAKIFGGASMFETSGPMKVGAENIQAVKKILSEANIPVVAEDVGGTKGRRITFDATDGSVAVETVGCEKKVL